MLKYVPLVRRIVRGLTSQVSATMERCDMEQIGLMGLLEALRRYGEPDNGFGVYATMRIRGAILDDLRRQDWLPRAKRQAVHRFRSVERELRIRLGREPTRDDVCVAMEITPEAYERLIQDDNAQTFASIDDIVTDVLDGMQGPEDGVADLQLVRLALSILTERERQVIGLYYQHDLNQSEIAKVLDLTPARICQISRRALHKMRHHLQSAA
nr:FliA/WhiG family RNA polymerase sigma factor [Dyella soli]